MAVPKKVIVKRPVKQPEMTLEEKIREQRYLKAEVEGMNERIAVLNKEIIGGILAKGERKIELDGKTTYVMVRSTVTYDPFGIKAEVTEDQWRGITSTVLDVKKLEAAVAAKEIPLDVVMKHAIEKESDPYIQTR